MKLNKEQETALMEVYTAWWESYLSGDVATYDSYLADDYRFVGSTKGEEYLNRSDTTAFFERTADQLAGKAVLKNLDRNVQLLEKGLVLITDLADAYVLNDAEWVYYSRFRFSSLMRKDKKGWRFIYQHFSAPDTKAREGETLGLEKISRENQELRDAIKRRTAELENKNRELEIETALERVRAKTMAMHSSTQLAETALVLYEQFELLGNIPDRMSIGIFREENNEVDLWPTDQTGKMLGRRFTGRLNGTPGMAKTFKAWKDGKESIVIDLSGPSLDHWLKFIREEMGLFIDDSHMQGRRVQQAAFFSHGMLLLTTNEPIAGSILQLLIRFAKVFSQTYTRFLDLQKAEAQAREAQIEAALERVRSKTMAMHNSEDVGSTVVTLFDEVLKLGLDKTIRCGIGIMEGTSRMETWSATFSSKGQVDLVMGMLDMTIHPLLVGTASAWRDKKPGYSYELIGEEVTNYYRGLNNSPDYPFNVDLDTLPDQVFNNSFCFNEGILFSFTSNPLSEEAAGVLKRFAGVFGQTYRRYLDLQKAEEQAREAQIEAALERVRSKALAMHRSEELLSVIEVVAEQLQQLNLDFDTVSFGNNTPEGDFKFWFISAGQPKPILIEVPPLDNPVQNTVKEAQKRGVSFITNVFTKKENREWIEHLIRYSELKHFPEKIKDFILNSPGFARSGFLMKNIALYVVNFRATPFTQEENAIFKRFALVFEQSYTRFLDLQKAEAQAREARVEASLERVRSKAMAMHNSKDLPDTASVIFEELRNHGINPMRCGISLHNRDNRKNLLYTATRSAKGEHLTLVGWAILDDHPVLSEIYDSWLRGEDYFPVLKGALLKSYYQKIQSSFAVPKEQQKGEHHGFFIAFTHGVIYGWGKHPVNDNERKLLKRFASVADLTFNRYFDLQKAEAQTREAQIEAALERIRARALAMHSSTELTDVANVLREQMGKLNQPELETSSVHLYHRSTQSIESWFAFRLPGKTTGKYQNGTANIPFESSVVSRKWAKMFFSDKMEYTVKIEGEELKEWLEVREKETPGATYKKSDTPSTLYSHFSKFSGGALVMVTLVEPGEISKLLQKRAAVVFDLAYKRFLDLQKSEAQAAEAIKQASLDRVRGEIASMRSTEDLQRITPLVFNELTTLGVPFIRCGVFIITEKTKTVEAYLSAPDGHTLAVMKLPFQVNEVTANTVKFWRKKAVYTVHWDRDEFLEWTESLIEQGFIKNKKKYLDADIPPESLDLHFIPFTQGMLYVGNERPLQEDEIDLAKSLADAFAIAYARYEDFVHLEKAKERTELALNELKATQNQLVQSEKMASLGELTAGIAHEIKNPLNFVNNFSEVSVELIEEMEDELDQGAIEEVKGLARDIRQNLEKILHHGKRADSIVKGMLQHSRASTGRKEPTDINVLCDEYLRLAYHGLRARDKSFNAKMISDFDETIGQVNIVPQEIGRVILNLLTNAFYAVTEKNRREAENFDPTVVVRTKKDKNKVFIVVEDNGDGIPEAVREKIFQPFFTTKPTGQGTGLGLSLSYDIVTKGHGGTLELVSVEGTGTTFTISLPLLR